MYVIKNRVTGEYDRKGHKPFHKVSRDAWSTLGQAKNHVAMRVRPCRIGVPDDALRWYCDADFIEITEDSSSGLNIIPVVSYLQTYFQAKEQHMSLYDSGLTGLTEEQRKLVWPEAGVMDNE